MFCLSISGLFIRLSVFCIFAGVTAIISAVFVESDLIATFFGGFVNNLSLTISSIEVRGLQTQEIEDKLVTKSTGVRFVPLCIYRVSPIRISDVDLNLT